MMQTSIIPDVSDAMKRLKDTVLMMCREIMTQGTKVIWE